MIIDGVIKDSLNRIKERVSGDHDQFPAEKPDLYFDGTVEIKGKTVMLEGKMGDVRRAVEAIILKEELKNVEAEWSIARGAEGSAVRANAPIHTLEQMSEATDRLRRERNRIDSLLNGPYKDALRSKDCTVIIA